MMPEEEEQEEREGEGKLHEGLAAPARVQPGLNS